MGTDGKYMKVQGKICGKGFNKKEGFDYNETFSTVVKSTTIWIVITLSLSFKWSIYQSDMHSAFLNGWLQEEVFMQQLSGFECTDKSLVCRLDKTLYSLSSVWFERLASTLRNSGFNSCRCEHSLFTRHKRSCNICFGVSLQKKKVFMAILPGL